MNPETPQPLEQVMWLPNPTRKATLDERRYINGTMRQQMVKQLNDLLGKEKAITVQDRVSRATYATVWLGLTPSAPDIKLSETYDWWDMVDQVFNEAAKEAETEERLVE